MAKRTRSGGVAADEEDSESCEASRHRRRCSGSGGDQFSRLDPDLVLEIAARLPSPCDARSLALASTELYSAIRPALSRVAFLTGYLRQRCVPGGPHRPAGFFLSTGSKTGRRRRDREGPAPAPDTVFVRGPCNILRGYNVVDPATFRAFLATAKRRRAHVVASSGHLLLCAHGGGAAAAARYSVVNPATDLWISLPPPPGRLEEAAAVYAGCPAFYCTAGAELTVAYLARRRRHSDHLVAHWFTSASGRWRSAPAAARGHLRPAAAAARAGGAFYWMLVDADAGSGFAKASRWPLQEHSPRAVMALNTNTAKSWKVPCPLMAVGEGEEPIAHLPRGLAMLCEADGLLRYCHTTQYPYPYPGHYRDQKLDGECLDVWTLDAAAAAGDTPAAATAAGNWQLRVLGDGDSADTHADEGADAEFWTWVLYNNIVQASATSNNIVLTSATWGCRAEDVAAGQAYDVFRYSPDSAS